MRSNKAILPAKHAKKREIGTGGNFLFFRVLSRISRAYIPRGFLFRGVSCEFVVPVFLCFLCFLCIPWLGFFLRTRTTK
ncbi:MAG: hypothetical protein DMF63_08515 [Acidobacteria bacterium]|nr:MAG: hypothetical protein DMF63_08515 [Acidobacteriota bacterium]